MIQTVLADTGPLYAAVDPDDQYHHRAQEQMTNLADAGISVVILYPALIVTWATPDSPGGEPVV